MKKIELTQRKHGRPLQPSGVFVKVDDEDFDELSGHRWHLSEGYARSNIGGKNTRMHRLICGNPYGMEIDHINADRLDNRRENLRVCTSSENNMNRKTNKGTASGLKGVYRHRKKWQAKIQLNGKTRNLGVHASPEDAARAYDKAAKEMFGDFARCHFP